MVKKNKSFEDNFEELKDIVEHLESRDFPLKESLEKFQNGMGLINQCNNELETAELEMATIIKRDGKIVTNELN